MGKYRKPYIKTAGIPVEGAVAAAASAGEAPGLV